MDGLLERHQQSFVHRRCAGSGRPNAPPESQRAKPIGRDFFPAVHCCYLQFWASGSLKKDALLCLSHPGLVETDFVYIGQLSSPQHFTIAIDRAEETEPNS